MSKVSVLVPVFNGLKYLEESLLSVMNQTHKDLEIIVVDDSSTESVWEFLQKFTKSDSRFKVAKNDRHRGCLPTLNHCMSMATGSFYARHDADDVSLFNRFEEQLKMFKEGVGFVGCWAMSVTETGKHEPIHTIDTECRCSSVELERLYPLKHCMADPVVMYRAAAAKEIGWFDEALVIGEAYNYNRRLQILGWRGVMATQVLYYRRRRPDSAMRTYPKSVKHVDFITLCNERAKNFTYIERPGWFNG